MRIQAFEQRVEKGEDETVLLSELAGELLELFQVHQPTMKKLPPIGVLVLLQSLGAIYGGAAGKPQTGPPSPTPRARKRTPSRPTPARRKATSR